jgi:hypothetical protein
MPAPTTATSQRADPCSGCVAGAGGAVVSQTVASTYFMI